MKKKALYASIFREIRQSKARFFSIMGIILLGVAFYAGIKATGPNMLKTAEDYFQEQALSDGRLMSPLGLEEEDLALVLADKEVAQAEALKGLDSNVRHHNRLVRFQSHTFEEKSLNQPRLIEGRLPEKATEIVLDQRSQLLEDYRLGDKLAIPEENSKDFRHQHYKIVGFVTSPLYIENMNRGVTSIGKGTIDYFALIAPSELTADTYSEIVYRYKGMTGLKSYSETYKKNVDQKNKNLKKSLAARGQQRFKNLEEQLDKEEQKLKEATATVADGQTALSAGKNQSELLTGPAKSELDERLAVEAERLKQAQAEIDKGKEQLGNKRRDLTRLNQGEYLVMSRESNPGYSEYKENANRLSAIATVFPVFFFLISALVCLTTMTRMVEEKRGELGALKALGYSNWDISLKFTIYAVVASVVGSLLGLIIGYQLFPSIIIDAYGSLYNLPKAEVTYYLGYALQSLVVAVMCTLLSALVVLRYDLFNTPATLLRPKAPKAGKRILLERLTPLWERLNFNQKVTARNLFRYKQRMFMTVLGVAGCMALMITGFGIRDSISDVVDLQFNKLWHYQGSVTFNEGTTKESLKSYKQTLSQLPNTPETLRVAQKNYDVKKKKNETLTVSVTVPETTKNLADYVLFNDRLTGKTYRLTDDGAIINEKLAKLTGVSVGDELLLRDSEGQSGKVKISQVVENYAMHFVYVTPTYYKQQFKTEPSYNSDLLLFKEDLSKEAEARVSEELLSDKQVANVLFLSQTSEAMTDTITSLNVVVWVLILSAALLAFIVLYNLTNINISERIRELSTIKVLGFYNREVTLYIYRENNILTVMGILVGCVIGKFLHQFVLGTAEVDMLMFSPTIHGLSYLYAALLTIVFSSVVMLIMHLKLKKVDMIEALKSTD